jgi:LPS-assembly protein
LPLTLFPSSRRFLERSLVVVGLAAGMVPAVLSQPALPAPKPPIVLEAAEIRARPDVDAVAEGDARFTQGKLEIRADRLSYDQAGDLARGTGNVQVFRDGNRYSGPELQVQVQRFEGYFLNPTYFFSRTQAGGTARRIDFLGEDVAVATGGTYTSCPRDGSGDPAWLLSTDSVKLDFANNEGIARGAVLRFYGVPILAAPTLSFPLTDARKSGWLPPSTGLDNKSGLQLSVPYYWNIAPNRDATLTPVLIAKRGVGLNTEFRYLTAGDEGKLNLNVLSNDRLKGESRGSLGLLHEGSFLGNGFYQASVARVSDDDYWKDFSRDYPGVTPRLLAADIQARKDFGDWTAYARVMRWQVLQVDPVVNVADLIVAPYDRLPQVGVRGLQRLPGGFEFALETEYNRFTNPDGNLDATRMTGSRVHALGSLSWPHVTPGWTLVPKVSLNTASYEVDPAPTAGQFSGRTGFSRSVPSLSLDSAWVLERDAEWFGKAMRQTLEPRLLYVRTPFREQRFLPNFDSAEKDFNFDSIYTDNAFSGIDRVSDGNQLTAGVTTRVLDSQTGSEALRLGIAQRFLFADQKVTANDGAPLTQRASDVLLLGSTNFWPKWKLDAGLQYNPDTQRTERSIMGVRYSPAPYRTVNFAYRLKRDESEQVELGWQWPIYGAVRDPSRGSLATSSSCPGTWYSVGRVNYSLRDSRVTDSVLGVEYDAGCWIGRLIAKRLSTSQQEATTQLGFEIEFVGLSRLGTNPLKVLKDNIPGYRLLRDNDSASTASPLNTP